MKHKYLYLFFALAVLIGSSYWLVSSPESGKLIIEQKDFDNLSQSVEVPNEIESDQREDIISQTVEEKNTKESTVENIEESSLDNKKEEIVVKSNIKVIDKLVSWGYQLKEKRSIDTIIIHSSYDAIGKDPYSVSGILKEYKDYEVAAHYLIDREGSIYKLVEEKNIAYHAGESKVPDGRTGVNSFSIGIELVNTKTAQCTSPQYDSLKKLISDIKSRYKIKYVLGHDEIAPGRKDDPWGFEWDRVR